jgi:hypothetical protein
MALRALPDVIPGANDPASLNPRRLIATTAPRLRQRLAWLALQAHHARIRHTHMRDLFAADPQRGERLIAEACSVYLDYS